MKNFIITMLSLFMLSSSAFAQDQSKFQWQIKVLNTKVASSLDSTSTIIEYGGNQTLIKNNNNAGLGNVYLLVNLKLHKSQVGGKGFDWKDVYMEDEKGTQFKRMANDTFLTTHGYPRLQLTKIMISNDGYIAFEIPEKTLQKKLYFVYQSEQGENKILIEK